MKRSLSLLLGRRATAHLAFFRKYPFYYFRLRGYVDIDGWLGYKEAVYLYKAAASLTGKTSPKVVEIGTWQGKSTVVMGKALQRCKDARIICIDAFNADGDLQSRPLYEERQRAIRVPLKKMCLENLARNRIEHIVQIVQGYSHEIVKAWRDPIDLLFIDGNHSYEAVKWDFDDWTPFLVPGGMLIMDDVFLEGGGLPGPARVVRESVLNQSGWYDLRTVGSLFSARRQCFGRGTQ